jgi:nucleoside-diphosphate-sugar epimerase
MGMSPAAIALALRYGPRRIYNICGDSISHNEANAIVSEEARLTRLRINAPEWAMIALAQAWTWLSRFTQAEPYYPINLRSYVFNDWQVSIAKARDELHFRPISFREGARRTLDWYRANPPR